MDKIWSTLSGHRALILGDASLGLIQKVAGRYEDVVVLGDVSKPTDEALDFSHMLNVRRADLAHLPFAWDTGYFDGVFTLNFLFPRLDWPQWVGEAIRAVKAKGRLLFIEPYPVFSRSSGCTVKIVQLWRDLMDQIPPKVAAKLISPEGLTSLLKANEIHHLRIHARLDVLGGEAEDWLPSPLVRQTFLQGFLPALMEAGVSAEALEIIRNLSDAVSSRSQVDFPVRILTGLKRRQIMPGLEVEMPPSPKPHGKTASPPSPSSVIPAVVPEEPEEHDPWKTIWNQGPESLSDVDLLALVIGEDSIPDTLRHTCKKMLLQYGSVTLAHEKSPKTLVESFGLNRQQAIRLVAAFELGKRFLSSSNLSDTILTSADDVFNYLKDMGTLKKEHLRGLYVDARGKLLLDDVLAIGSLTTSTVHPRDVFVPALESAATAVILAHNHPSGDPKPSTEDIHLTKQLKEAGQLLGIDIVDHIIISGSSYLSMSDLKLL